MSLSPLAWVDMQAWSALTGTDPTRDEWRLIRAIDNIFLEVMRAHA